MEIIQENNEKDGFFKAIENGKEAGIITYLWSGRDKFIIEHTIVNEEFEGRGIGKKLVLEVVDFARQNHVKILPYCSFAKKVFEKTEEIQDVLF